MKILWLDINSSYSHSSVALPAIHAQVRDNQNWEWCVVRGTINDKPGALAALNEFRRNRIEEVVDYTMETLPAVNPYEYIKVDVYGEPLTPLLNSILNERRKELFMEGDRWYELKRNGRPEFWSAKQGRKYTTYKFMYTFPLPIQDVEIVKGLIQNPGYDKVQ